MLGGMKGLRVVWEDSYLTSFSLVYWSLNSFTDIHKTIKKNATIATKSVKGAILRLDIYGNLSS